MRQQSYHDLDGNYRKRINKMFRDQATEVCKTYLNTLLVSNFAIFEEFLIQFLIRLLSKENKLLKRIEQLNLNFRINNSLTFENLVSATFTSELLQHIYLTAARSIVSGEIAKSLKRIESLTHVDFDSSNIKFFKRFQDDRNRIVHESNNIELSIDLVNEFEAELEKTFETIKNIFTKYEISFLESHIPIKDWPPKQ